jgi:hypothetical protein
LQSRGHLGGEEAEFVNVLIGEHGYAVRGQLPGRLARPVADDPPIDDEVLERDVLAGVLEEDVVAPDVADEVDMDAYVDWGATSVQRLRFPGPSGSEGVPAGTARHGSAAR